MATLTKVQLAEQALAQAKDEEKLNYRKQELESLISDYKGKCIATHTFNRYSNAGHKSAVYYEDFYIENGEVFSRHWCINLSKCDSYYKVRAKEITYQKHVYVKQLTGQNEYSASYNLYSGYSYFKHEIPLEKFMYLWEVAEEANVIISQAFNGKIPEVKDEWISQGDHTDEERISSFLKSIGVEMIDLKDYPKAHSVLEYCTLPLFDRCRWLPKQYAKKILKHQISLWEKEKSSMFITSRVIETLDSRINIIKEFILTLNL